MYDLFAAFAISVAISIILFLLGSWIGRTRSIVESNVAALIAFWGLGIYLFYLRDNLLLATWLPISSLIILGNWLPFWFGLLSGLAWSLIPRLNATAINNSRTQTSITEPPIKSESSRTGINWGVLTRRLFVVITMQGLGWGSVLYSIRGVPPPCHDQWDGEICIQTDDSTCSAACAATILKAHGIETTESEMASLCLTRKGGTLWQGLYRGLKLKTAGTAWDVAIISGSLETLRSIETKAAILAVGIPKGELVPPIYTEQYGWTPGVLHSVLFFGFREQGLVSMGEPTPGVGKENWSEEDLRILWRGRGMTLIARE